MMKRPATNLDRDVVLELAARAIINMVDLRDAARCLFEKNFYPQARSVAITALEELGKLALALSYLKGDITEEDFLRRVHSHHPKQRWGNLLAYLAPLTQRFVEQHGEMISGVEFIKHLDDRMGPQLDRLVQELQEKESELEAFANYLMSGQVERERRDGWYVSLVVDDEPPRVTHPRMVDREKAESVLKLLSHVDGGSAGVSFDWTSFFGINEEFEQLPEDQQLEAFKRKLDQIAVPIK